MRKKIEPPDLTATRLPKSGTQRLRAYINFASDEKRADTNAHLLLNQQPLNFVVVLVSKMDMVWEFDETDVIIRWSSLTKFKFVQDSKEMLIKHFSDTNESLRVKTYRL